MENNFPRSENIAENRETKKIPYNPDAVFKGKEVSFFGASDNIKIQFEEFTQASGKQKWINSFVVVIVFLVIEALIIANYPPARNFVVSFFSLNR